MSGKVVDGQERRTPTWGLEVSELTSNGEPESVGLYNAAYGNFADTVQAAVRREAFGEDIGQTSWLTAEELRGFLTRLGAGPGSSLLDVACGSGGPAVFAARTTGCRVTGVDINEKGIAAAQEAARSLQLDALAHFRVTDAGKPLPFEDESFDTLICVDAINHFPDRLQVLGEWRRVLRGGGRVLFTDPIVVTGLLSNEEIAARSSIGCFIFAPPSEDEKLVEAAGFELVEKEDVTENMAVISGRWHEARARHRNDLLHIEGEETYEGQQRFLSMVRRLAEDRRLSRFAFLARKPASG